MEKRYLALILAVIVVSVSMIPIDAKAAGEVIETFTIDASDVTYQDENCSDGYGWRYGEYKEAGEDVSNRVYVKFPINSLIAYKMAGADSYNISIDMTWVSGSGLYSGTYPSSVLCDSYDWQTWLVMWSNNKDVAGQRAAQSGTINQRYYTFPDVNYSSTEISETDLTICNYIEYEMLMTANNIAERACMRTSLINAVMTITVTYENEQKMQIAIDNHNANVVTKIEGNQNTIIDKITSGFASVGESVKTGVTNAVNELFVPDEQAVQDFFTNMNEMEEEHLKPIAQVKDTVNTIEQTLFNPDYDAQISGDLAPVAGYINTVQGDGVFIFPGYEMKLKEGNFPLWEDYVIDVGATLDDMGLSWIPTVTKAICIALFTWRFLIMVLRWLMKVTENPTFGQWADMLATFDFNYKTGW